MTLKLNMWNVIILLAYALLALYAWVNLPATVTVHWDAQGMGNGTASKLWGIGLFPLLGVFILGLFTLIPLIEPKRANIARFAGEYMKFSLVMQGFFLWVFALFIAANMGLSFSFVNGLAPAFAVLIFYVGGLLEHAKQNYFIGIRTPWTLDNERVWDETHRRTGKLLKIVAVFPLLGLLTGNGQVGWMVIPLVVVLAYGMVLSFFLHRKYTRNKRA